jgi:hypothetical protein
MKINLKNLSVGQVFWPSNISVPRGDSAHQLFIDELCSKCITSTLKSLKPTGKTKYRKATRWLVYGLHQSHFAIPNVPLAMPMSQEDFSKSSAYDLPFGYRIINRLVHAALDLGFCAVELGQYNSQGKGRITRLRPAGRLLDHFEHKGIEWTLIEPPSKKSSIILARSKGGKDRIFVDRRSSKDVPRMQDNLYKINSYLSQQCIYIDLPNAALNSGRFHNKNLNVDEFKYDYESTGSSLCVQQIFLRRIFAQNSLERGGRFYGGWWQMIPSPLRRRVMINGDRTAEVDYSGLIFAQLYARESLPLTDDPYDLGQGLTDTKKKRGLVKKFMIASLNDQAGSYRLSDSELEQLGISHYQLKRVVFKKHKCIKSYFGSGIGLEMQFVDSEMAEQVMLRMNAAGEVCLPIHDSFIVRWAAVAMLSRIMAEVFLSKHGQPIGVKVEIGIEGRSLSNPDPSLLASTVDLSTLIQNYERHLAAYSVVMEYFNSWQRQNFDDEDLELSCHALNDARAHAKDSGRPFFDIYKFNGIPVFMRHLGMPHSSPLRETGSSF